jgi:hypothetical protein
MVATPDSGGDTVTNSALRACLIASVMIGSGCGSDAGAFVPPSHLPERLTPSRLGALQFQREPGAEAKYKKAGATSLLKEGRVYSIRHGDIVEGSLQVSLFQPDVRSDDARVLAGIEQTIAEGTFEERTVHNQKVNVMRLPDQNIYLWFPPRTNAMSLLVVRHQFRSGDTLMRAVIEYQQGRVPIPVPVPSPSFVTAPPVTGQPEPGRAPGASSSPSVRP